MQHAKAKRHVMSDLITAVPHPTESFTNVEPQNSSIDLSELHKKSAEFEIVKTLIRQSLTRGTCNKDAISYTLIRSGKKVLN